jgi:hypothetical protein
MNRVELDGLSIHPGVGTLGTLDASYKIPVSAETIDLTPIVPTAVKCFGR